MSHYRIFFWQDDGIVQIDPDWICDEHSYAALDILDATNIELWEEYQRTYEAWIHARAVLRDAVKPPVPLTPKERAILAARRALQEALALDDGPAE